MRVKELDGLRGIAVLAVVNCHYMSWYPYVGSTYGWLGVDLFFVLSGFLITCILLELREGTHYYRIFYSRRALRIFPPYLLGLTVYFVVSLARGKHGLWSMWVSYLFYYSSLFRFQPTIQHGAAAVPVVVAFGLTVLWSLSVEELYYSIWAPVVRFVNERGFVCILVVMTVAAPVLRWRMHTAQHLETFTFYCRMDGLAYGSAVALLTRWRRRSLADSVRWDRLFDCLMVASLLLAVAFAAVFGGNPASLAVDSVGITIADFCFAFVTYALVRHTGGSQWWVRIFRATWLRTVGMVSYSLYLFHYPLYIASARIVEELHLTRRLTAVAGVSLALVLSFAVAFGLWYGMESRILRWKERYVPRIPPREGQSPNPLWDYDRFDQLDPLDSGNAARRNL